MSSRHDLAALRVVLLSRRAPVTTPLVYCTLPLRPLEVHTAARSARAAVSGELHQMQCQARPATLWGVCRRQRSSCRGAGARGVVYASTSASPGERLGATSRKATVPHRTGPRSGRRAAARAAWSPAMTPVGTLHASARAPAPDGRLVVSVPRELAPPRCVAARQRCLTPAGVPGCERTTRALAHDAAYPVLAGLFSHAAPRVG